MSSFFTTSLLIVMNCRLLKPPRKRRSCRSSRPHDANRVRSGGGASSTPVICIIGGLAGGMGSGLENRIRTPRLGISLGCGSRPAGSAGRISFYAMKTAATAARAASANLTKPAPLLPRIERVPGGADPQIRRENRVQAMKTAATAVCEASVCLARKKLRFCRGSG